LEQSHIVQDGVSGFHAHFMDLGTGRYAGCIVSYFNGKIFLAAVEQGAVAIFGRVDNGGLFIGFSGGFSDIDEGACCDSGMAGEKILVRKGWIFVSFVGLRVGKVGFVMQFSEDFFVDDTKGVIIVAVGVLRVVFVLN
jgi:hypothetical protein